MKHTEGEWQTSKMSGGDIEIWAPGTPKIATVHLRYTAINEHKDNVKLIAAAPKLFERLKKLVEEWNEEEKDENKLFDSFYEAKLLINEIET